MKLFGYRIYFYNPFKKRGDERLIGIQGFKDWHHTFEWDIRVSLFKYPHITGCYARTTKTEYVISWWHITSKSYRRHCGGLKWFETSVQRQGIDEGRCGSC